MQLINWFPAITTTALLSFALWLLRKVIATRLTRSVEFEFNKKLEELRAEHRKAEENLKAELRAKEAQINALQSGALAAMVSRRQAVDKRRLEAVDQLWSAVKALAPARHIALVMTMIKWDTAAPYAERDPKARKFFETIGQGFDPKTLDLSMAHKARPFVSPMVWAAYSAYTAVCMHGAMRQMALKLGVGGKELADTDEVNKLVVAALPHYETYLKEHGTLAYYHVLPALEDKLLTEIRSMLSGSEGDVDALAQASTIIALANKLTAKDAGAA